MEHPLPYKNLQWHALFPMAKAIGGCFFGWSNMITDFLARTLRNCGVQAEGYGWPYLVLAMELVLAIWPGLAVITFGGWVAA